MKKLILLSIGLLISFTAFSQTPEEMKAWQDNMTPGENHEWLASMTGNWDATVTVWMDTSKPPNISTATAKNDMIMNGLYQRSSHNGEMWGQPFMGESIIGYDNGKKEFIATWIDNFGSSIMLMKGQLDKDTNALTLEGTMMDPATGKDMQVKQVITKKSEDSHKFEMFTVVDGKDIKNMEINYTKSK